MFGGRRHASRPACDVLAFVAIACAAAYAVHAASAAVSALLLPSDGLTPRAGRGHRSYFSALGGALGEHETVVDFEHASRGWRRVASHPVGVSESHGLWHQGELWTIGGYPTSSAPAPSALTNVHRFQPALNRWVAGPSLPDRAHVHHTFTSCYSIGHTIVSIGGLRGDKAKPAAGYPHMCVDGGRGLAL
jgi:N-acetylneuraminic acid mutarotase